MRGSRGHVRCGATVGDRARLLVGRERVRRGDDSSASRIASFRDIHGDRWRVRVGQPDLHARRDARPVSVADLLRAGVVELLDVEIQVGGWATCPTCNGKGKLKGGRGGLTYPTRYATRQVPTYEASDHSTKQTVSPHRFAFREWIASWSWSARTHTRPGRTRRSRTR